jgi:hypothetical protein
VPAGYARRRIIIVHAVPVPGEPVLALILAIALTAGTSPAPEVTPSPAAPDSTPRFRTLDAGALGRDVAPGPSQEAKPSLSVSPFT